MKRILILLGVLGLIALGAVAPFSGYGRASAERLGWRMDTTAAALAAAAVIIAVLTAVLLSSLAWALQAPARISRNRGEARRRARHEALSRGFVALAAGDTAEARRQAALADAPSEGAPVHPLGRLLAAWAAEAEGDLKAAILAYEPLLAHPETRLAGRRGLMLIARRIGDEEAGLAHARAAYTDDASAAWAWRMLFEDRLKAQDWDGATELADAAERRRTLPVGAAGRLRTAVEAARRDGRSDPRLFEEAMREPAPSSAH